MWKRGTQKAETQGPSDPHTPRTAPGIHTDSPETNPDKDIYGFSEYSKHIASVVSNRSESGLVVALQGAWGSGKTTILNFVKRHLAENPNTVLIDFNPWWFTNKEDLVTQFFGQFQANLNDDEAKSRELRGLVASYAEQISSAIILYSGGPAILREALSKALSRIKPAPKSVQAIKKDIAKVMRQYNCQFVFVIDDLDRLPKNEICEVFKVVKALADFPNTTYLLAFDEELAKSAIEKEFSQNGARYLEKIIQVSFHVPTIYRSDLRNKFLQELAITVENTTINPYDQNYWSAVYSEGLEKYISLPRDVNRISNSIRALLPVISKEVNLVDFVAIEFLRIFEPAAYQAIRNNKARFIGQEDADDKTEADNGSFHKEWLEKISYSHRERASIVCSYLFPRTARHIKTGYLSGDSAKNWRSNLRICSPEVFDVYFRFSVPKNIVGRSDLEKLIDIAESAREVEQFLIENFDVKSPGGTPKTYELLSRIDDVKQKLTLDKSAKLLRALLNVGDQLGFPGKEYYRPFDTPNSWRILFALLSVIEALPRDKRVETLTTALIHGRALCMGVHLVDFFEDALNKEGSSQSERIVFDLKDVEHFKLLLLNRIPSMSINQIVALNSPGLILSRWYDWAPDKQQVQDLFNTIINNPENLLRLLSKSVSWGAVGAQIVVNSEIRFIQKLTNLETFSDKVNDAISKRPHLSDEENEGVLAFQRAYAKIRAGKDPYEPFPDD